MTRFKTMRPATRAGTFDSAKNSLVESPCSKCKASERCVLLKSFGNAAPSARILSSFAFRRAISSCSSWLVSDDMCLPRLRRWPLKPLLQAGLDKEIELTVEYGLGIRRFNVGPKIFDTRGI